MAYGEQLKSDLRRYAAEIGIDMIGFCSPQAIGSGKDVYQRYLSHGYSSGFEEQDLAKRYGPAQILPDVATIIVVGLAYPDEESKLVVEPGRGFFCRASWGQDYHQVIRERLALLHDYLQARADGLKSRAIVDTGALSDRESAICAGLGQVGRHSNVITKIWGSLVFFGQLLINIPLPDDKPESGDPCQGCQKCVHACPTNAIDGAGRLVNSQRCLAYWTLAKGTPPADILRQIGRSGYLYGCDICQLVCPHNKKRPPVKQEAFRSLGSESSPDILALLAMSNRSFGAAFGHLSGSWRGKRVLARNGIYILGYRRYPPAENVFRDMLASAVQDDLRQALIWALGQYEAHRL